MPRKCISKLGAFDFIVKCLHLLYATVSVQVVIKSVSLLENSQLKTSAPCLKVHTELVESGAHISNVLHPCTAGMHVDVLLSRLETLSRWDLRNLRTVCCLDLSVHLSGSTTRSQEILNITFCWQGLVVPMGSLVQTCRFLYTEGEKSRCFF